MAYRMAHRTRIKICGLTRRENALKVLKDEFGYDAETLQRAQKALRPSLSHKKEILRIVDRLGFASDADVTKAWIGLSKTTGQILAVDGGLHEAFLR